MLRSLYRHGAGRPSCLRRGEMTGIDPLAEQPPRRGGVRDRHDAHRIQAARVEHRHDLALAVGAQRALAATPGGRHRVVGEFWHIDLGNCFGSISFDV